MAFHNAGAALFGVKDYVPALMEYVERYGIDLEFNSTLIAIDGPARKATFRRAEGEQTLDFDMIHICPPQKAPAFVADSPLAAPNGFVDVDQLTLRHSRFPNVFGLATAAALPKRRPQPLRASRRPPSR